MTGELEKSTGTASMSADATASTGNGGTSTSASVTTDIDQVEQELATVLAQIAVRSVGMAVAQDPQELAEVEANGYNTPEFQALVATEMPAEVRSWIATEFRSQTGVVMDCVRSMLEVALPRYRCADPTSPVVPHGTIYCTHGPITPSGGDPDPPPQCEPFCASGGP